MGAWGAGSFENDDASDWVWELEKAKNTDVLSETLAAVVDAEEIPEATDSSMAIAAAEVVAALALRPAEGLPEEAAAYAVRIGAPPPQELVSLALRALARIEAESELQELWDESGNGEEWRTALAELRSRLA